MAQAALPLLMHYAGIACIPRRAQRKQQLWHPRLSYHYATHGGARISGLRSHYRRALRLAFRLERLGVRWLRLLNCWYTISSMFAMRFLRTSSHLAHLFLLPTEAPAGYLPFQRGKSRSDHRTPRFARTYACHLRMPGLVLLRFTILKAALLTWGSEGERC